MIRRTIVVGIAVAAVFLLSAVARAEVVRGIVVYVEEQSGIVHLADGRIVVLTPSPGSRETAVTGSTKSPAALPRVLRDAADIPPERIRFVRGPQAP